MQQYIISERTKEITIKFDALSLGCVLFAWVDDSSAGEGALFVDARAGAAQIERNNRSATTAAEMATDVKWGRGIQ